MTEEVVAWGFSIWRSYLIYNSSSKGKKLSQSNQTIKLLFIYFKMMASKFLYDEGVDDEVFNDEWAASADMETEDINELERQFLSAIVSRIYSKTCIF